MEEAAGLADATKAGRAASSIPRWVASRPTFAHEIDPVPAEATR